MKVRTELKHTEDILTSLLEFWDAQGLNSKQKSMLVQTMRWSYMRGILSETIEQVLMHRILSEEDEDDEL